MMPPYKKYRLAPPIDTIGVSTTPPIVLVYRPKLNVKQLSSPHWWFVLPCLFLIVFCTASDPILMNDLIIHRYERYYGMSTSTDTQRTACQQTMVPMMYWQHLYFDFEPNLPRQYLDYSHVQRDAASFNVKNSIAILVASIFTFILLGANSDLIGRRPLIVFPFIGKIILYTLMLIIISRDLSNNWIIVVHVLEGIFGSGGLVILSGFAYITDCTNQTRTRCFFIAEVVIIIARIIPVVGVSVWLRYFKYIAPLSLNLSLSVIGLLYTIFVQPESVEKVKNLSVIQQLTRVRLKPIVRTITVFIVKRSGRKQQWLIILTIVVIFLLFMLYGYVTMFALYLYGRPFCLNAFSVGMISLAQALTIIPIALIFMFCQNQCDDTYILPIIGSSCFMIGMVLFGIAKQIWLLYLAACISSVFFVVLPILRTKLTKQVEENEYAIMFIAAGVIETVGYDAVGATSNSIYKYSLHFFPGLIFLILACIGIFPIVLMCYLTLTKLRIKKRRLQLARTS